MLRIYLLLLALTASSCNITSEQAAAYLRSEGHSQVQGVAICMADSQQFRCVMTDYQGCGPRNDIACEKFYTERPAP